MSTGYLHCAHKLYDIFVNTNEIKFSLVQTEKNAAAQAVGTRESILYRVYRAVRIEHFVKMLLKLPLNRTLFQYWNERNERCSFSLFPIAME